MAIFINKRVLNFAQGTFVRKDTARLMNWITLIAHERTKLNSLLQKKDH